MFGAANALEGVFLGSKDAITPMMGWLVAGLITVALQLFFITPQTSANAAMLWAGGALTMGQTFIFFYLWKISHGRGLFSMRSVFKGAESARAAIARLYRRLEEEHIASEFRWLVLSATARMTTYVIITSCATNLGVISAAVNKTLLDLYILLGLCAEPVFTVGNVLLPRKRRNQVDVLIYRRALFYIALFMGSSLAYLAYILCGSTMLSHDPHVHAVATSMRSLVAVTIGLSTTAYATDGCVIGLGEASFVGAAQIINTSIFVLMFITFRMIYGAATSLHHLWTALLLFQALRVAEHVWKLRHDERALALQGAPALN
jgi:Na+-driven multidrug efflux pump